MPLFMPDEELAALASDAASMVAERADEYIRKELSQTEKCLLIFQDLGLELTKVRSSFEEVSSSHKQSLAEARAELARSQDLAKSSQAALADHKLASQAEKRQLMELLEEKDAEISEKNSTIKTIKSCLDKMMSEELCTAKEEIDKLRGEIESSKSHMLQYKSIAQVNETALKQMESAHENFRQEAEKKQRSLEAEIVALTERVSELAND